MKNLLENRGAVYEMSRFGQRFKKKFRYGNWKKLKKQRRLRTFSKLAHDMMPADCGLGL